MSLRGIIMLDGPDGSGKTSLARALVDAAQARHVEAVILHSAYKEAANCWADHSAMLFDAVREAFTGSGKVVILDRFFLSEAIYGDVYRGGSAYPAAARHLDRLLYRFWALRVLCAPPVKFVRENHAKLKNERHEQFFSSMDVVAQRYLDVWEGAPDCQVGEYYQEYADLEYSQQLCLTGGVKDKEDWYRYDVTNDGRDVMGYAGFLLDELKLSGLDASLATSPMHDALNVSFTGDPSAAEVLLVGDTLAGPNEFSIPFFADGGSSLYLAETLQKLGVDEGKVCIANVNDYGGVNVVHELSKRRRVVVMGREAEKTMVALKLAFDWSVRHPQHARRFSHNDDSYAQELAVAFRGTKTSVTAA